MSKTSQFIKLLLIRRISKLKDMLGIISGRVFVNTFYPSSKLCSSCGWKNETLKLTDRVFECKVCNSKIYRDMNAAINLKQWYTGSSLGIDASGDRSSPNLDLVSLSLKEESNLKSSFRFL